jgi:hypothetical protein
MLFPTPTGRGGTDIMVLIEEAVSKGQPLLFSPMSLFNSPFLLT